MKNDIGQVLQDRRDVIKGTAAAAGALLLPGLAQAAPRKGGILRVAMPYNPGSVDPMTGRVADEGDEPAPP
jgi:TAT (twin-arginine translocation) pathway signal sequence